MKAVAVLVVAAILVAAVIGYLLAAGSSGSAPPAFVAPPGSWTLGPGCEFATNGSHEIQQAMRTCEDVVPRPGNVSFVQGDVLLTNLHPYVPPRSVAALFSWYVSNVSFPDPLPNYSSIPAGAHQIGSVVLETWGASITQWLNLSTGSVPIYPGWYVVVVIDASPDVHAETQVSSIVIPPGATP